MKAIKMRSSCLLVLILLIASIPVQAEDSIEVLAIYFGDEYKQTSAGAPVWQGSYWGGGAGTLDSEFLPAFSTLTLKSHAGNTYELSPTPWDADWWEADDISDAFGNASGTAIFRAYDASDNLIGTAEWTLPSSWLNGSGPKPPVAPHITSGPEGSFWSTGKLWVDAGSPISISFNAGSWVNFLNDEDRFDEIEVVLRSEAGDERRDFASFSEFDHYDPVTGIATVVFDGDAYPREAGHTYGGWIEYRGAGLFPEGYGSTSGVLDGYVLGAGFDKVLDFDMAVVPEPSSLLALMGGLGVMGGFIRRRK